MEQRRKARLEARARRGFSLARVGSTLGAVCAGFGATAAAGVVDVNKVTPPPPASSLPLLPLRAAPPTRANDVDRAHRRFPLHETWTSNLLDSSRKNTSTACVTKATMFFFNSNEIKSLLHCFIVHAQSFMGIRWTGPRLVLRW